MKIKNSQNRFGVVNQQNKFATGDLTGLRKKQTKPGKIKNPQNIFRLVDQHNKLATGDLTGPRNKQN